MYVFKVCIDMCRNIFYRKFWGLERDNFHILLLSKMFPISFIFSTKHAPLTPSSPPSHHHSWTYSPISCYLWMKYYLSLSSHSVSQLNIVMKVNRVSTCASPQPSFLLNTHLQSFHGNSFVLGTKANFSLPLFLLK